MRKYLLLAFCIAQTPAWAANSPWQMVDGAQLRLVAQNLGNGRIEAALQIDLQEGWKTYWKVPGSSGMPPVIGLSSDPFGGSLGARAITTISYPTPVAFRDGNGWTAGYKQDVTFLIEVEKSDGVERLHASGYLGICSEVCIPVQFSLVTELADAALSDAEAYRVLAAARATLPSTPDDRPTVARLSTKGSSVELKVPESAKSAFWFDLSQGAPVPAESVENGVARFGLPDYSLTADKALVVVDDLHGTFVTLP